MRYTGMSREEAEKIFTDACKEYRAAVKGCEYALYRAGITTRIRSVKKDAKIHTTMTFTQGEKVLLRTVVMHKVTQFARAIAALEE